MSEKRSHGRKRGALPPEEERITKRTSNTSKSQARENRRKRDATLEAQGEATRASRATSFGYVKGVRLGCINWPIAEPEEPVPVTKCPTCYAWGSGRWQKPIRVSQSNDPL